jgi:hypothetical protein
MRAQRTLTTRMMLGCFLGAILGWTNVILVAYAMHASDPSLHMGLILSIGLIPGTVTGAVVGLVAGATAAKPWRRRALALVVPAALVVAFLGCVFDLERYIVLAWIPTIAGCLLLERATREPPVLPRAHMER